MNYRRFSLVVVAVACISLVSCDKVSYRKSKSGIVYRVFPGKDSGKLNPGMILKLIFTQKIGDSVYYSNIGKPAFYTPVPKEAQPYDVAELWTSLEVGDSIVTVQAMDTFINRNPQGMPPQFRKGDKITTYIKIIDAFPSAVEAVKDETEDKQKFQDKEVAEVEKYLKDKKIDYAKTPSGAFVEVISEGSGVPADSGRYVSVNYTGTSFSGTRFDSNTDTAFHHVEPYGFTVGAGEMIKGFDEGIMLLNKGGKAKVYVPSMLAYGGNPGSPLIKPYEHLIFEVEVVDVQDSRPILRKGPAIQPQNPQTEPPGK